MNRSLPLPLPAIYALVLLALLLAVPGASYPADMGNSVSSDNGSALPSVEGRKPEEGLQYMRGAGELPGVTWVDDIHPIFVRNECWRCHDTKSPVTLESMPDYSLGLVDEDDKANGYWSYHELVYSELNGTVREGEALRDGQCCWPEDKPAPQRRRIWLGHPERSVLMHKLDRDYYDWDNPPRFLEEALKLRWGAPMPWTPKGRLSEFDEGEMVKLRNAFEQAALYTRLWLGRTKGTDIPVKLRDRIPEGDRAMIRYWIANSMELAKPGTAIEVSVTTQDGKPAADTEVVLVGSLTYPERQDISDTVTIMSNADGIAVLNIPAISIASRFWFAAARTGEKLTDFVPVRISEGERSRADIRLPQAAKPKPQKPAPRSQSSPAFTVPFTGNK